MIRMTCLFHREAKHRVRSRKVRSSCTTRCPLAQVVNTPHVPGSPFPAVPVSSGPMAEAIAPNPLRRGLVEDRTGDACAVVIFGASGDLTRRKLMPALYNLAWSRALPGGFAVVGQARREKTDESFRAEMKEAVSAFSRRKPIDATLWTDFERGLSYVRGAADSPATYEALRA